ncbi:hypothetical protein [Haloferax sp. DFSO52]|uniref:hypothetical protein n=1 Tax=Haloferax sp. DFSO52 TaxID=3388505 RepID=UPI003A84F2C0
MGNENSGGPKRTHSEQPGAIEEPPRRVAPDYVDRILQYEWADALVSAPPETAEINWVPGHVGSSWGRVAPDVWSTIRVQGYDPHFRHYPTHERFEHGEFEFELCFPLVTDGASGTTPPEQIQSTLRERLDDYLSNGQPGPSWESASVVTESQEVLWRATYQYESCDSVGYTNTLRQAIEDHEWMVELVHEVVEEVASN